VRRGPQQEPIDDAEHRDVRADAQCERDHGGKRETRRAAERAQGESQVLADAVEQLHAHGVLLPSLGELPAVVAGIVQVAEESECLAPRGVGRPSIRDQLTCPHLEVKRELIVDLFVGGAAGLVEGRADPADASHDLRA
jgi:hypothetical protein